MKSKWPSIKAKYLLIKQNHLSSDLDGVVTAFRDGEVVLRSERRTEGFTEATEFIGYQGVKKGELVVHSMDAFAGAIGISKSDGRMSPVVHIYRGIAGVDLRYYAYCLKHLSNVGYIQSLSKGIRERSTSFDPAILKELLLPFPPLHEQRRIADYLDVETKRIQDVITLKKNLVAKYDELFNSVRNYLVVGKSGIGNIKNGEEWFSSVPSHWTKKPLRLLFSWQKGKDPARLDATYCSQNPGPFPVYSGQTSNDGIFGEIDTYDFDFKVECNLITTVGARAGSMKVLTGKFSLSQNCALLEPKSEEMSASYLNFLWPTIWNDLSSKIPSDMQPSVRLDDLKQIWVYFPPKDEQSEIVFKLQQMESEYLAARSAVLASIDLYNEYMNAIVTEKVTGHFSESNAKAVF